MASFRGSCVALLLLCCAGASLQGAGGQEGGGARWERQWGIMAGGEGGVAEHHLRHVRVRADEGHGGQLSGLGSGGVEVGGGEERRAIAWRDMGGGVHTRSHTGLPAGFGAGPKCLTATVPRPLVGECVDLFARPVNIRVCVTDQTAAEGRAHWSEERLSIADLSTTPWVEPAQAYVNQECRAVWQDWVVPPDFVHTCYGGDKEMEPCGGKDDYFTCTLGTCIRLKERPDWPVDWWNTVARSQFGGIPPVRFDVRNWYCTSTPGLALGEIRIGNIGTQTYYAPSSNPWISSECDTFDDLGNPLPNPDTQCVGVTEDNRVLKQCCGACILNMAHMMQMYNCTGLTTIIGNDMALNVLANYCRKTLECRESRPCLGDPVAMGDPTVFLNPATYNIECDQLDSGCNADGTQCKYRWACDNSIEALRERIGFWRGLGARARASPTTIATVAALLVGLLLVGLGTE